MAIKPYTIVGSYLDPEVPWVVTDIVYATDGWKGDGDDCKS